MSKYTEVHSMTASATKLMPIRNMSYHSKLPRFPAADTLPRVAATFTEKKKLKKRVPSSKLRKGPYLNISMEVLDPEHTNNLNKSMEFLVAPQAPQEGLQSLPKKGTSKTKQRNFQPLSQVAKKLKLAVDFDRSLEATTQIKYGKIFSIEELSAEDEQTYSTTLFQPYLRQVFADLVVRSASKSTPAVAVLGDQQQVPLRYVGKQEAGPMLDKIGFLSYCDLPGMVNERLHFLFSSHYEIVAAKQRSSGSKVEGDEAENDLHDPISEENFLRCITEIFCGNAAAKMRFIFKIYDFDCDGLISKQDVILIWSHLMGEEAFKKAGVSSFLDEVFGNDSMFVSPEGKMNVKQFIQVNREISSELFYSLISLLHTKLPCALRHYYLISQFKPAGVKPTSDLAAPTYVSSIVNEFNDHLKSAASAASVKVSSFSFPQNIKSRLSMNEITQLSQAVQAEEFNSRHSSLFARSQLNQFKNQTAIPTIDRSKIKPLGFELIASITPNEAKPGAKSQLSQHKPSFAAQNSHLSRGKSQVSQNGRDSSCKEEDRLFLPKLSSCGTSVVVDDYDQCTRSNSLQFNPQASKEPSSIHLKMPQLSRIRGQATAETSLNSTMFISRDYTTSSQSVIPKKIQGAFGLQTNSSSTDVSPITYGDANYNQGPQVLKGFGDYPRLVREAEEQKQEGECYLKTKSDRFKRFKIALVGRDIFFFRLQDRPEITSSGIFPLDEECKLIHTLHQASIKEIDSEYSESMSKLLFPLKLQLPPSKGRVLYFRSESYQYQWLKIFRQALQVEKQEVQKAYDFEKKIGMGQFGTIMKAHSTIFSKEVAVKQIYKKDMTARERLQLGREIQVHKLAKHPSLVQFVELFENLTHTYVVLEHLPGGDLYEYLKARNFAIPEEKARELARTIGEGIRHLHSLGIVHRDLKLENIMMTSDSDDAKPKIIDFGLAKFFGPKERSRDPFGTLGYVAPEILKKDLHSLTADSWSFGCIIYALLSGSLPFDFRSPDDIVRMTVDGKLRFDDPRWLSLSISCRDLVSKLLDKNPAKRLSIEQALEHPWLKKKSGHQRRRLVKPKSVLANTKK